jgi:hypothetical protein
MAKDVHDDVLDAALNYIKTNCDKQVLCSAEPTTYTEANVTFNLAEVAMADADFTIAAGATSGRKVTPGAKSANASGTNTATWVAWLDTSASKILAKTTVTSIALTSGSTVNFPTPSYTIPDPS